MGPLHVMSVGPGTYCLDFPSCMASVDLWYHTSLLKAAGPQPTGLPTLEYDFYKVKDIL